MINIGLSSIVLVVSLFVFHNGKAIVVGKVGVAGSYMLKMK